MKKQIEIEARGMLSNEQKSNLFEFLKKNGVHKEHKNRILIDYSLFLPDGGIRDRKKDIRLRVTNGKPEIIVKLGKWGAGEKRHEISVLAESGSFDKLVEIFAALGYRKGALCIRNSEVYDYKDTEFSIVEVPGHSCYFEAEKLSSEGKNHDALYLEIESLCQQLGLKPFDEESFMKYIEVLNKEANEVFDYNNYYPGYFKKRFKL